MCSPRSSGTTQSVSTCTTAGSSSTYTLQPRETLVCAVFDGMITNEYDVPWFQMVGVHKLHRYCKSCPVEIIHMCEGAS